MQFTYDPRKNDMNILKHGLSFEVVSKFNFEKALFWQDVREDYLEGRFCALGYIGKRLHALVFTPREDSFRVISLRKANRREVKHYEQRQTS